LPSSEARRLPASDPRGGKDGKHGKGRKHGNCGKRGKEGKDGAYVLWRNSADPGQAP
jgi:hypothetical protein